MASSWAVGACEGSARWVGWARKEWAPVLGGSAMDTEVKRCGLFLFVCGRDDVLAQEFISQIVSSRWSPEFAGVPPRALARRRCVCSVSWCGSV